MPRITRGWDPDIGPITRPQIKLYRKKLACHIAENMRFYPYLSGMFLKDVNEYILKRFKYIWRLDIVDVPIRETETYLFMHRTDFFRDRFVVRCNDNGLTAWVITDEEFHDTLYNRTKPFHPALNVT